jgi:hypothetical protein
MSKNTKNIFQNLTGVEMSLWKYTTCYCLIRVRSGMLSLVIQREGTKLPEIFDLIIRVFVSTTISTSERSERVEIV